ncbi:lef-1 [Trichoplusia ni granulovirus LBIV-12]|uniref:Lef-1 n=1 Tax=Trichoplusia ni granulovirus LBIV-12 TaxID=1916701 RepID=A0A1D8QL96_GVTN|nr:lef-1 [Trichoplusia ni granulovirus LBIV-12]AOW41415.1 lef-1 [Trichoplusia ni granulovirus LBIV-12]
MYTAERARLIWDNVKYNTERYWAVTKKQNDGQLTWIHTDGKYSKQQTFNSFEQFHQFLRSTNAQDVHVKKTVQGGREWVIDVDHHADQCPLKIALKNKIAHRTYATFFGENAIRIMDSGNRGIHIWLDGDMMKFRMSATTLERAYYLKCVLTPPSKINDKLARPGSLVHAFVQALENKDVKRAITELYPNINTRNYDAMLKEFYPYVDKQVFESTKQIRAPYSFHSKGNRFNTPHVLL